MGLVFATVRELEKLSERIDQLDTDMSAIAQAIRKNNVNTQAILDAINDAEKPINCPVCGADEITDAGIVGKLHIVKAS